MTTMNIYTSGSLVSTVAQFVNRTGAPTDTTATLKYRAGTAAVQTITGGSLTHDGLGAYHFDIDTSGWAGPDILTYVCQWVGTGGVQAINDDYFGVKPPAL